MSKVVSLRLSDDQIERLQRAGRRLGRSPSEAAALLLEEALRQREYAFIEFRDSAAGRQAYLQGTRLAVWQIVSLARDYAGDVGNTAAHLELPLSQVAAALQYAAGYPNEIDAAIADNAWAAAHLVQLIPNLQVIEVDAPAP
ncbi:MAG: transcriptional regulator [Dehalococcoidia bacterium]|nr:transcriptional regulator [Dehalococcoidia bacterium]